MWANRLLSLHPAILSITYVALFVLGGALTGAVSNNVVYVVFGALFSFLVAALAVLWALGLHTAALSTLKRKVDLKLGSQAFVFGVAIAGLFALFVVAPIAEFFGYVQIARTSGETTSALSSVITTAFAVVLVSYFAAMWIAADSLVRFEERQSAVPWNRTVGTFLLVFYAPIGVWFLWPRIKRLLSA